MNEYGLVKHEVNQRIEWAKEWQAKGAKIYAATNIDAAYDAIRKFDESKIVVPNNCSLKEYFGQRRRTERVVKTLRNKLKRAIDKIAAID